MSQDSTNILRFECQRDSCEMQNDGDGIYRCLCCGWRIRLMTDVPPEGWYEYQDINHPELLPVCLACGERTSLVGAGWYVPPRPCRMIHFWCTNTEVHPNRGMNAYMKEISQEEFIALEARLPGGIAHFFLSCLGVEGETGLRRLSTAFDVSGQQPWILNVSSQPDSSRSELLKELIYFERNGALSNLSSDGDTICFRIGPEIVAAIAELAGLFATNDQESEPN